MQSIRTRTFKILDIGESSDQVSRIIDIFLISLISLNVLSVILETLPSLESRYQSFFNTFEIISVIIFSAEYLMRVWCSIESTGKEFQNPFWGRLRYMFTPMAIIDLIVIMPFYFGLFLTIDLRFMRVLRLLRVFKLTRYSSSMSLLLKVLSDEAKSIGAALFVLCLLVIMASSITYLAEHDAQPEAFSSIPAAMWWAIITMTSVGYGDVAPITVVGKILASLISILSIGIVALPAGILASGFSEEIRKRRLHYEKLVDHVMEDGIITADEARTLKQTQQSLGLDTDEANYILDNSRSKNKDTGQEKKANTQKQIHRLGHISCPHCGEGIHFGAK